MSGLVVSDLSVTLGGKPIETLTPDEARQQPTPTDAVMSVLKKKGKARAARLEKAKA